MPTALHAKLASEAKKKFGNTTSERAMKFIFGTMHTIEMAKKNRKNKSMNKH